ncbi:carboxypeptidase-like regulatory domain-containing protein [Nonlabens sp.]|uniref:carboxypeptidase-like regulatory domain-containing protein n=1 Tax=Nonlabens sp. TaxID=1888209 RepID=UPI003262CE61
MKSISFLFLITSLFSYSQQKISGTVHDNNGSLFGAIISIHKTNKVTSTDFDGNYSILATTGDTLHFKHDGYFSDQAVVENDTIIKTKMKMIAPYTYIGYQGVYMKCFGAFTIPINYLPLRDLLMARKNMENSITTQLIDGRLISLDGIFINKKEFNNIPPLEIKSIILLKNSKENIGHMKTTPHLIITTKEENFKNLFEFIKDFRDTIPVDLRK